MGSGRVLDQKWMWLKTGVALFLQFHLKRRKWIGRVGSWYFKPEIGMGWPKVATCNILLYLSFKTIYTEFHMNLKLQLRNCRGHTTCSFWNCWQTLFPICVESWRSYDMLNPRCVFLYARKVHLIFVVGRCIEIKATVLLYYTPLHILS